MNNNLFENDSDSDDNNNQFITNANYAKSYNKFREKELLKKLKDRDIAADSGDSRGSSSSSESDYSDDEIVNAKFDVDFYKTLASLKRKDPKIYDKDVKFFQDENNSITGLKGKRKEKALTIKDFERKVMLERGGIYEDEEDVHRAASPSNIDEEKQIKDEFRKLMNNDDDEDSENEEWGGIFKKREKTKEEQNEEDEQYTKWLTGEKVKINDEAVKVLEPLKKYWSNPKLTKDEQFLRNYILNNGYLNKNQDNVPTYDEICGDDNDNHFNINNIELSEDENELEKQAEFEHKYNFRYEEPDKEFIKRYPRTIEQSVRKVDDRRKIKRQEKRERKQKEKEQNQRELEMLKALKRKEIEEKIEKLKSVSGIDVNLPFTDNDIDNDFDPDEYDRCMQKVFNDEYYQIDEGEEKPKCPDDIEELQIDEDWDNYDPKKYNDDAYVTGDDVHCEDDQFNMDCDFLDETDKRKETFQSELIDSTRDHRSKRRKRKSKFMEMLHKQKPIFDPNDEKTYGQYIDEYYKLDYEDRIGDVKCRFKYVETVPNDFGLTIEEILLAKNKELNQWASLKKAVQIRPEHIERNEMKTFKIKGQNEYLKRKILRSLYEPSSDEEDAIAEEALKDLAKKNAEQKQTKSVNKSDEKSKKTIRKDLERKNIEQTQSKPIEKIQKTVTNELKTIENHQNQQNDGGVSKKINIEKIVPSKKGKKNKVKTPQSSSRSKNTIETTLPILKKKNQLLKNTTKDNFIKPKTKVKIENSIKIKNISNQKIMKKKLNKKSSTSAGEAAQKLSKLNKSLDLIMKNKINLKSKPKNLNKLNNKNTIKKLQQQKIINKKSLGGIDQQISDDRLRAFGINPKKYHKKIKYAKVNQSNQTNGKPTSESNKNILRKKKKQSLKIRQLEVKQ